MISHLDLAKKIIAALEKKQYALLNCSQVKYIEEAIEVTPEELEEVLQSVFNQFRKEYFKELGMNID